MGLRMDRVRRTRCGYGYACRCRRVPVPLRKAEVFALGGGHRCCERGLMAERTGYGALKDEPRPPAIVVGTNPQPPGPDAPSPTFVAANPSRCSHGQHLSRGIPLLAMNVPFLFCLLVEGWVFLRWPDLGLSWGGAAASARAGGCSFCCTNGGNGRLGVAVRAFSVVRALGRVGARPFLLSRLHLGGKRRGPVRSLTRSDRS